MQTHSWKRPLLSLAAEAVHPSAAALATSEDPGADLEGAYVYAESLTAFHSRSFHLASRLLPAPKRRALRALYAFCRVGDDIVDNPKGNPEMELAEWRRRALAPQPPTYDPVALAWADTRQRYLIPRAMWSSSSMVWRAIFIRSAMRLSLSWPPTAMGWPQRLG